MDDIDVINEAVRNFIEANEVNDIGDLCIINNASRVLIELPIRNDNTKYTKKVPIKKSIKYVMDFLMEINPEYYKYFIKRLEDGTFIFDKESTDNNAYSTYDIIDNKRIIYIPVMNTIEDAFSIVHEIMHDMNLTMDDLYFENVSRYYFTEGLSILMEFLFENYLISKNIKDARVNNEKIFFAFRIKAVLTDFNLRLVNHYLENGYITKYDIVDIMGLYNNIELSFIVDSLEEIVETGELTIENEQSYIISALISTYMYNRIKKNKKNIQELFDMNELIQNNNFQAVLDYLDLDYDDIDLKPSTYSLLKNNYKNFIKSR